MQNVQSCIAIREISLFQGFCVYIVSSLLLRAYLFALELNEGGV